MRKPSPTAAQTCASSCSAVPRRTSSRSTTAVSNGAHVGFVGDVIKKLIGVDPTQYGVWQQSNDGEDKPIDNDKFAELQDRGLEVFFTAKKESTEGFTP